MHQNQFLNRSLIQVVNQLLKVSPHQVPQVNLFQDRAMLQAQKVLHFQRQHLIQAVSRHHIQLQVHSQIHYLPHFQLQNL